MSTDRRPGGRRPWLRLLNALLDLAGDHASLLSHGETPWASATFAGARHVVVLEFHGNAGVAAAETFIAALPEHEFALPGKLVADAAVVAIEHRTLPTVGVIIQAELLLLEE